MYDKTNTRIFDLSLTSSASETCLCRPTGLIHKDADDDDSPVVGAVGGAFAWDASLRFLLPEGVDGIVAILSNDCNQTFTYLLNGPDALFMGEGDQHDPKYDDMRSYVNLALHANPAAATSGGHCQYSMVRDITDEKLWGCFHA